MEIITNIITTLIVLTIIAMVVAVGVHFGRQFLANRTTGQASPAPQGRHAHDPIRQLNAASISNVLTLFGGVCISLIIGSLFGLFIQVIAGGGFIFGTLFAGAVCFWLGLRTIPVAHKGILLVLGTRYGEDGYTRGEKVLLNEGLHWVPMGLVAILIVDVRERSVPSMGTYLVSTQSVQPGAVLPPDARSGGTSFDVKAKVQYRVSNPFVLLNAGEGVVHSDLVDMIDAAILQAAAESTPATFPHINTALTDRIIGQCTGGGGIVGPQIERWGITLLNANIESIKHSRGETLEAYERLFIEEQQQAGEAVQTETILQNAEAFKARFPGISDQDALLVAQRISGQLTAQEYVFTGSVNPMMAAAAVHANQQPTTPPANP